MLAQRDQSAGGASILSQCWFTALALFIASHHVALAQHHLEPERGSLNEMEVGLDYAKGLLKTLLKDAASQYRARVVCLPSFRPGWVVTLVREGDEEPIYTLEYASFEDQPGRPPGAARVRRVRAPIDREAAEVVQEIWLRMLREVHYPKEPRVGADGTEYHFSRFVPLTGDDPLAPPGWESGRIWTPDPDSATGRLAAVAEALRNYAIAPAEDRTKFRKNIIRGVDELRSRLKNL